VADQRNSSSICPSVDTPEASKCSPQKWQPEPGDAIFCDHVGMLVFASSLSSITAITTTI
jgi:hypothetical protein